MGEPAPDFALRSLDGQTIRLSELRGRTVLVNFWATWCGPCRAEMPDLQAVYDEHKENLVVLAVNVEGTNLDEARRLARDFRDELGLTFPIVLDSPDGDVFAQYKLRGLPDSFFVPGHWVWNGTGYAWRAGYWARVQPGYVWVAAHYRWTPGGYVFIPGYWDLAVASRGVMYAPIIVDPAVVTTVIASGANPAVMPVWLPLAPRATVCAAAS